MALSKLVGYFQEKHSDGRDTYLVHNEDRNQS